ncbi:hypothetical protein KBZ10_00755 [Streptomyces sp. F63]|uniref:hypothetical protein n=1 Tax=Streptomyces sp. F63 TaxID=2824887 RepID=UPI001B380857|nr:hypothetical protein [Streptomyces sp. F63]MBQ0983090.1 hypothetical protein [Streptomyces sp. F63]
MKRVLGAVAIIAGAVLAIFLPDIEFGWFRGRPFGLVLMVLGAIELLESARGRKPRGIVEELRDDFGLGSRRDHDRDHDRQAGTDGERHRDRERHPDRERE